MMTNEIFVDGICELDDKTIRTYFSRFGSRILTYHSHRHRPTNSCCFAFISFVSAHTVNAVLRHRVHSINHHLLFVKRLLPENLCSFNERLLPVSSVFIYKEKNHEINEQKFKNYFKRFGQILSFKFDQFQNRFYLEYNDYDSVDRLILCKDQLPLPVEIHKDISPNAQNSIQYFGTCRRTQKKERKEEKKRKRSEKKKQLKKEYENLLQRAVENLTQCRADLRNKENDYAVLQLENLALKEGNEKQCEDYRMTISTFEQALIRLNEQHEMLKSQYQRLLLRESRTSINTVASSTALPLVRSSAFFSHRQSISTRLNLVEHGKQEVPNHHSSQSISSSPVVQSTIDRFRLHEHRTRYQYQSVNSDF